MELFDPVVDADKNWLPYDGVVQYHGKIFDARQADALYAELLNTIAWQHDKAVIMGKVIETKRMVAWYASEPFAYRYSGVTKVALLWTDTLHQIKAQVEQHAGEQFNSCLLNLYHFGDEGMTWHSDGERELKKDGTIASVSLGAERQFSFKHKQTNQRVDMRLAHGSLMVMKGTTQTHWLHRLPPTKKVKTGRINLTFRQMMGAR